ncbi:MAG TPA: heat-inducible transcriptional repressor HrcA [Dehalococcoidia bacterium]|nr:heat-inducible transcriptional repressor HrcA [Dehalococcoidia bacterium]
MRVLTTKSTLLTEDLTPRRAEVLKLVVHEYVDSAIPVGSQTLVSKYNLQLSSATIRNEMARLEEEAYITHPHTSAGRVPSDRGYRYFVETLMPEDDLTAEEKATIRHQFHQAAREVDAWIELAATILSQTARSLSLVTAPRSARTRLKHIELLELNDRSVLMVAVLQEARVVQKLIALPEPVSQADLSEISARFNQLYSGSSEDEMKAVSEASEAELTFFEAVREILRAEDAGHQPETRTDGLKNVLAQPEFQHSDHLLEVLEAVDERNLSKVIPFQRLKEGGVLVMIGGENRDQSMREFSVVVSEYGVPGAVRGALGVVGPTRMRYPRMISTVRYMSEVMSDLMAAVHRNESVEEAAG